MKRIILLCIALLVYLNATAQEYTVNGNAEPFETCNCYRLTQDLGTQSGSVWNNNLINLENSFDFSFDVYLGCSDAGADGIAFLLQPLGTSIGTSGGGLGYTGIAPSLGVEIDTYHNGWDSLTTDHVSLNYDGVSTHDQGLPIVDALFSGANIEDCTYHDFRVVWDATTQTMTAYFDSELKFTYTFPYDVVDSIFGGNPEVFWGFTGSTGGAWNEQRFCISFDPLFNTSSSSFYYCNQLDVSFTDLSVSGLNSITDWAWNFGDGTAVVHTQNPTHTYATLGTYDVLLIITDLSGCTDSLLQTIYLNPIPSATPISTNVSCNGADDGIITLTSVVAGGGPITIQSTPAITFLPLGLDNYAAAGLSAGTYNIYIQNDSADCVSPTYTVTITEPAIVPSPIADDVTYCQYLASVPLTATGSDLKWYTSIGGIGSSTAPTPSTTSAGTTTYYVTQTIGGCESEPTAIDAIIIPGVLVNAGPDLILYKGNTITISASTTATSYTWTPATGLSATDVLNPVCSATESTTYYLTVTDANGCTNIDSVEVSVFDPNIYMPNAFSPNNDNENDHLMPIYFGIQELYHFRIFNRWGEKIFETNQLSSFWDGTYKNTPQPIGTYVYDIEALDFNNRKVKLSGNISLLQ